MFVSPLVPTVLYPHTDISAVGLSCSPFGANGISPHTTHPLWLRWCLVVGTDIGIDGDDVGVGGDGKVCYLLVIQCCCRCVFTLGELLWWLFFCEPSSSSPDASVTKVTSPPADNQLTILNSTTKTKARTIRRDRTNAPRSRKSPPP